MPENKKPSKVIQICPCTKGIYDFIALTDDGRVLVFDSDPYLPDGWKELTPWEVAGVQKSRNV